MNNYTITLTNTEKLAMEYIAYDPQNWVENAMRERARLAIDEIIKIAVNKFLEIGETIPGSKDDIVAAAYERGWIHTSKYTTDNSTSSF